ncbi:hypothetical protein HMPREF0072_0290 [Anaerococcus lactolyticus ATCC 51172]|uniref:Uncharacterized protein n=2 Tax=Anaerococcus lactolyticus TaxID=33032 RepID=C2BD70_9FIRM|nr:hypothetical protein HMPREF0072_0290 [Anaerococcus lactolyticus ATCC 51172]
MKISILLIIYYFHKFKGVKMKNKLIQLQDKIENNKISLKIKRKIVAFLSPMLVILSPYIAYADISGVNMDVDENTAFAGMINVVIKIAKYVGISLVIVGIITFLEAQHSENPERKTTSIKLFVTGVCLVGIEYLLKATGLVH